MNGDGVETGACKGDVWRNEASRTFETHDQAYAGILPMLRRLDERLASAVDAANRVFASRAAGDLYRGLAISPEDVVAALARTPGEPFLPICTQPIGPETCESPSGARLAWLQRVYGLTDFDLDVILVALAPEIDLRYERIYAYLHDDVSRRRPSVDLALNVLCASAGEKLRQRARFAADGPLVRSRVIEIYADPLQTNSPLLSHSYRLDEQIVRLLFIDDSCDSRLREFCRMVHARAPETGAPLSESLQQQLHALTSANAESPLRLYFHGPANCGQPEAAALLAEALSLRVLNADIRGLGETTTTMNDVLSALVREAWLREALLYLRGVDMAGEPAPWDKYNALWCALQELAVNCVIEGQAAWIPAVEKPQGVITIAFDYPAVEQREQWWRQCLAQHNLETDAQTLATLAQRYRITYSQIQHAAAVAMPSEMSEHKSGTASWSKRPVHAKDLFAVARAQCGHDLATLATKVYPRATWDDLVLSADAIAQLHEICDRFDYRDKVLSEWGFGNKLSRGRGINVLFSGGSGTGKTMAAEVIANALGLDLYRIDVARVVSKYIGETEKNLDRVFTAAEGANAVLLFDEADALFGKRSEVKDAHDRYANIEISYLLQKMEEHEGIAILTTNLADNVDRSFLRRIAVVVFFQFPDAPTRAAIWRRVWPDAAPLSADLDLCFLAENVKLSGSGIKNIARTAAFSAASQGVPIALAQVIRAAGDEYLKDGRVPKMPDSTRKDARHG